MGMMQDFKDWQPTKAHLGWSVAAGSVATIAAGFMLGLVVTSGTAEDMAQAASRAGQTEVAAHVCAENFAMSDAAAAQHAELATLTTLRQRQFVQNQPWAAVPGFTNVSREVADTCARLILQMDPAALQRPTVNDA